MMNTNELDRDESVLARLLELEDEHPSNRHHFVCEPDELESRQLLSAVQAATSSETSVPQAVGATAGLGQTAGFAGTAGTGSTVVAQTTGGIDYLQSQVPINDLLANLSQVTADVYETPSPITAANGLLSLPITPLLAPGITELETPLNNGTNEEGTVWITPPPLPPGLFHLGSTLPPFNTNTMMQMPNPQWGPPTLTHFGQSANGSLNGTAVEEPIATGPVGPSITEEIGPVQPPPVSGHQPFGPPAQLQQDETAPQRNGMTPPGGQEGAGGNGTPGQGAAPGQPGGSATQGQQRGAGGETTQGIESTTPNVPASAGVRMRSGGNSSQVGPQGNGGAQGQSGAEHGGAANPGSSSGGSQGRGSESSGRPDGSAYWIDPERLHPDRRVDPDADVIDAAITSLADNGESLQPDAEGDSTLSTAFGAAAVAIGGLRIALRDPSRARSNVEAGPDSPSGPSHGPRREPVGV